MFTNKTIAFLGDSITLGYALEDRTNRFATVLSKRFGAVEENYGITGTLVAKAGLSRDNDTAYITRIANTDNAEYAVVFGGTNDYFWSDMPISPEGESDDVGYFTVALEKICAHLIAHHEKNKVLLVTPYPHHGIGNFKGGENFKDKSEHDTTELNYNGYTIKDYVDKTIEIANKFGLPVLDLHTNSDFDWKKHTVDGCHPNNEGHIWLADKIEKKLYEIAKQ